MGKKIVGLSPLGSALNPYLVRSKGMLWMFGNSSVMWSRACPVCAMEAFPVGSE